MTAPRQPPRWLHLFASRSFALSLLAGIPLCLCAVWAFTYYAEQKFAAAMARSARERLVLYSSTLDAALNKFSYLSHILAVNQDVLRLVKHGDNADTVNAYLEEVNRAAGAMELFVLNGRGVTVAASNWNNAESFVGHDYHFRPYYHNALYSGQGKYFAVGATTGKPGFFFSRPILDPEKPSERPSPATGPIPNAVGVAVTKVDLAMMQRGWREGGETAFITDEHGIIFLSSRDEWRYRATRPLSDEAADAMLYQRQYGNVLPADIPFRAYTLGEMHLVDLAGQTWLYTTRTLADYGWTIWFLTPMTALKQERDTVWLIGCGMVAILVLLLLLTRTFFAWNRARRGALEARRIQAVNRRLAKEIRIRKATERELLAAQDDLLHASRMAALGQVAASVAHELSQPVTSMRMFAASCRRLAHEGRHDKVAQTMDHMVDLVERIKILIDQLKHFSRKVPGKAGPVALATALRNALTILQFEQEAVGCALTVTCPEDAVITADAVQVEQVLINLLHNALDAVKTLNPTEERNVTVVVSPEPERVTLVISDTGPGIDPAIAEQIFTPFFTTKKSGEGIGLGLAIVDNIVRAMRGDILVTPVVPHGTRFIITLPRAADKDAYND